MLRADGAMGGRSKGPRRALKADGNGRNAIKGRWEAGLRNTKSGDTDPHSVDKVSVLLLLFPPKLVVEPKSSLSILPHITKSDRPRVSEIFNASLLFVGFSVGVGGENGHRIQA